MPGPSGPKIRRLPTDQLPAAEWPNVIGAIRERWLALGGPQSWLGNPLGNESEFAEGGRVSSFENGEIYWWPDVGAIELKGVVLHYTGLICFGETDEASASDEPYSVIGIMSPSGTSTYTTRVYEDTDGGESEPDLHELYRGKPVGMTITVLMMEHDEGDPNKYRDAVKTGVDKGFDAAKPFLSKVPVPVLGQVLAVVGPPILDALAPVVTDALNKLLGTADDTIGHTTIFLSPKQMVILAARTSNFWERGIGFKAATGVISGDGASYRVYFGLVPA